VLYGQAEAAANTVAAMDITVDTAHAASARRRRRRVPWSPHAWGQAVYLAAGIPVQLIGGLLLAGLIAAPRLALLWLAAAVLVFLLSPVLTRVHRSRLRATAGVEIAPLPRRGGLLSPRGLSAAVRAQSTWRQFAYHMLIAPLLAAAAAVAVGLWPAGLTCALTYLWAWTLRHNETSAFDLGKGGHHLRLVLTLVGIAGLFAAPWFTAGVRRLDVWLSTALLGPSRADELEYRVEQLTETRAGVVDAADAERRRLERDLHDGTQQRLVSLAINLGMARAQASTAEQAKQAIAEAHEEAKAALAELRGLIRGLHPAVLEDRGLDAALSGITARMPIPVRLTVDLQRRPAPVIEAVAYFVVSEGLANIAKHAQATEAAVFVQQSGDRLHVIVTDDGVGGADPVLGTGLAGLARRAASVDGTFEIDSPPGGPTLLTVDLPCNR
jgi:signal transduction histidine kinase